MLPKMNVYEFLESFTPRMTNTKKLVNVRGTNGSGKSTIPFSMLAADPKSFELTYAFENRERVIATVFPTLGWLALGSYRTACGGLDSYKTTEQTFDSIRLLWDLPFNILMEGVISSTVRGSYLDFFKSVNGEMENPRDIIIFTLLPPFETCLARIQVRNGGKAIKQDQVLSKYRTIERNVQHFKDAGLDSRSGDNSTITKEETLNWFLASIGESLTTVEAPEMPSKAPAAPVVKTGTQPYRNALWLPSADEVAQYEWASYYKAPNDQVTVNDECFRQFWYWIHERQEIWQKRVNEGLPRPWTNDKILQEYKFTHACRDLDRLSIYYIKQVLSKLQDTEQSKKEVMLNTMIYRLFCRLDTWEMFGYLHLDNWDTEWENAKALLRAKKKRGEPVFTDAYYVNDLHAANPDPVTRHDKTENAICLIEIWYNRLDEIYNNVAFSASMRDALEYLKTLPCVGHFTAYEWVCDFAWSHTYTDVQLVPWTIDSYTNVGPGAQRGLRYVFENRGNLSELQCIIYLRAAAKHYMAELGYDDLKLPPEVPELNLRCIEHSLCEYQKYRKAYEGNGRPKVKFTHKTKDIGQLRL